MSVHRMLSPRAVLDRLSPRGCGLDVCVSPRQSQRDSTGSEAVDTKPIWPKTIPKREKDEATHNEYAKKIEALENALTESRKKARRLEARVTEMDIVAKRSNEFNASRTQELEIFKQRNQMLGQALTENQSHSERLQAEAQRFQAKIQRLEARVHELETMLGRPKRRSSEARTQQLEESAESAEARAKNVESLYAQMTTRCDVLEREHLELQTKVRSLEANVVKKNSKILSLKKALVAAEDLNKSMKVSFPDVERLQKENQELQEAVREAQDEVKDVRENLRSALEINGENLRSALESLAISDVHPSQDPLSPPDSGESPKGEQKSLRRSLVVAAKELDGQQGRVEALEADIQDLEENLDVLRKSARSSKAEVELKTEALHVLAVENEHLRDEHLKASEKLAHQLELEQSLIAEISKSEQLEEEVILLRHAFQLAECHNDDWERNVDFRIEKTCRSEQDEDVGAQFKFSKPLWYPEAANPAVPKFPLSK